MENNELYCFGDLPVSELTHSDESAVESTTFGDLPITALIHSEAESDDAPNDELAGEFTSFGDMSVGELMHDDSLAHDDADVENDDVCCFGDLSVSDLEHSGIKGMKWGVRRYQNPDGSLTPAGKKRYNQELAKVREAEKTLKNKQATKAKIDRLNARKKAVEEGEAELESVPARTKSTSKKGTSTTVEVAPKKKTAKDMSDAELRDAVNRMQLEKQYNTLQSELNPKKVSTGKEFVKKLGKNVLDSTADAAKTATKSFMEKKLKEVLGVDDKGDGDSLKKTVEQLELEARGIEAKNKISKGNAKPKEKSKIEKELEELQTKKKLYETKQQVAALKELEKNNWKKDKKNQNK